MKKKNKAFVIILVCVLLASFAATGFGWFYNSLTEKMSVTSYVRKSYFESGTGTAEDPFEIKYPVQLYYFTWLQDMGYFNQPLDNQRRVPLTHFYVSDDLDMSGFVLPPIGSQQFPFLGEFSGKDKKGRKHVISNLTVCNQSEGSELTDVPDETKAPDGLTDISEKFDPQIVGFFGVVGEYKGIQSTNKEAVSVHDFNLNNVTVRSNQPKWDKTLVGIAVGYVNGKVQNVGVANSTVEVREGIQPLDSDKLTDNISDYTLEGYCTSEYIDQLDVEKVSAAKPSLKVGIKDSSSQGQGNAWGGSIDMLTMYDRLDGIRAIAPAVDYPLEETRIAQPDGTTYSIYNSNGKKTFYEKNTGNANFTFYKEYSGSRFIYLYGAKPYTLTVHHKTQILTPTDAFYITDGHSNYLNISSDFQSIENGTSEETATKWITDAYGRIYMSGPDGIFRFLETKDGLSIMSSPIENDHEAKTSWTYDPATGFLSYPKTNPTFSLKLKDGKWQVCQDFTQKTTIKNDSGNFLCLNAAKNGIENGTDASQATKWTFTFSDSTNHSGLIYTVIDGTHYYVMGSKGKGGQPLKITSDESQATFWNNEGNKLKDSKYPSYGISYNPKPTDDLGPWRYRKQLTKLTFTDSDKISNNPTSVTFTPTTTNKIALSDATTSTEESAYGKDTYFPLAVSDTNISVTSPANTGYIIAGANTTQSENGDIRVSRYNMNNIGASTNNAASYSKDTKMEILTRTADSGGYCRIEDDYNKNNTEVSTEMTKHTSSKRPYGDVENGLHLKKYKDSRDKLQAMFEGDPENIYGLHFMDAAISMTHTIRAPSVTVNGDSFTNYQMPQDCIDFHLKERGHINFFSGTYFKNKDTEVPNNSFFSLHEIVRGTNNDITDIREIKKVYGKENDSQAAYIYEYGDGQYSDPAFFSDNAEYKMLFDLSWITNPNANGGMLQNAVYYFEIPVNDGEYALGSVPGSDGAYLFYLDISANARPTRNQELTEITEQNRERYAYPKGIQLLEHSALHGTGPLDPTDSVSAAQPLSGFNTTISRKGNKATMTETGQTVNFVGADLTLNDELGNPLVAEAVTSKIVREKKVTLIDNDIVSDVVTTKVTRTVYTKTVDEDGTPTENVTIQINDNPSTNGTEEDYIPIISDPYLRYHFTVPTTLTVTHEFKPLYDEVTDYPEIGQESNLSDQIKEYQITVKPTEDLTIVIDENKFTYKVTINGNTVNERAVTALPEKPKQEITISPPVTS